MITITKQASNHLHDVSKGQDKVEFSIEGGGCSGDGQSPLRALAAQNPERHQHPRNQKAGCLLTHRWTCSASANP